MVDESDCSNHFYYLDKSKVKSFVDMLIPGMLPRVGVGILYGASSAGKSLLCMRLAASIATKEPLVSGTVDSNLGVPRYSGKTVYFCGEGESAYYARLRAATLSLPNIYREKYFVLQPGLPIIPFGIGYNKLRGIDQLDQIEAQIQLIGEKHRCDKEPLRLIVFDTLLACMDIKDENHNAEMQRVYDAFKHIAHKLDCFVLVVTHPTKYKRDTTPSIRGAGAAPNSVDIVMELKKINASAIRELTMKKVRDGMPTGGHFYFKEVVVEDSAAIVPDDRWTNVSQHNSSKTSNRILDKDRIYEALKMDKLPSLNKEEVFAHLCEVIEAARKAEGKLRSQASIKKQVNRSLDYLIKQGKIQLDGSGKPLMQETVVDEEKTNLDLAKVHFRTVNLDDIIAKQNC